jgi:hypothetical protein
LGARDHHGLAANITTAEPFPKNEWRSFLPVVEFAVPINLHRLTTPWARIAVITDQDRIGYILRHRSASYHDITAWRAAAVSF